MRNKLTANGTWPQLVIMYKKNIFKETDGRGWIVLWVPEQGPLGWFCENMYVNFELI